MHIFLRAKRETAKATWLHGNNSQPDVYTKAHTVLQPNVQKAPDLLVFRVGRTLSCPSKRHVLFSSHPLLSPKAGKETENPFRSYPIKTFYFGPVTFRRAGASLLLRKNPPCCGPREGGEEGNPSTGASPSTANTQAS